MFGVADTLYVKEIELNKRILIEWSDGTQVEWIFTPLPDNGTFVAIINSGFKGDGDEIVYQAIDSMGGYTMILCAIKALLEHNVNLNVVIDGKLTESMD